MADSARPAEIDALIARLNDEHNPWRDSLHQEAAAALAALRADAVPRELILLELAELPDKIGLWFDEHGRYYRLNDVAREAKP